MTYPNISSWLQTLAATGLLIGTYGFGGDNRFVQIVVLAAGFLSIRAIGVTMDFSHGGEYPTEGAMLLFAMAFISVCCWRFVAKTYALRIFIPALIGVYAYGYNLMHEDDGLSLCCSWSD
jgi:hypothetical protein